MIAMSPHSHPTTYNSRQHNHTLNHILRYSFQLLIIIISANIEHYYAFLVLPSSNIVLISLLLKFFIYIMSKPKQNTFICLHILVVSNCKTIVYLTTVQDLKSIICIYITIRSKNNIQ